MSLNERLGRRRQQKRLSSLAARKERREKRHVRPQLEELEARTLLSASGATPALTATEPAPAGTAQPLLQVVPQSKGPGGITGLTPQQVQGAYGFTNIPTVNGTKITGAGETIAIVDAYNDPNIVKDAATFNAQFNLQPFNVGGGPTLKVVSQTGGSASSVGTDPTGGWELEESLDVEYAHAMAPGANILLVEANLASFSDLNAAVQYAASRPNVVTVSMSWGGFEFSGESGSDSVFVTPAGHPGGVTFVAAAGDSSAFFGPIFPAVSPNVLAVGGTTLQTGTKNGKPVWSSETGWVDGGGGASRFEGEPSFQSDTIGPVTVHPANAKVFARLNPDVSYNAGNDPGSIFDSNYDLYDTFKFGGWTEVEGTSAGSPQWASIITLADQARKAAGQGASLDNLQVGTTLYNALKNPAQYGQAFHDITTGNNFYAAHAGYDLNTGLGSPQVNNLVPLLAHTTVAPGAVHVTGHGIGTTGSVTTAVRFGAFAPGGALYASGGSISLPASVSAAVPASTSQAATASPALDLAFSALGTPAGIGSDLGGQAAPAGGATATALLASVAAPPVQANSVLGSTAATSTSAPLGDTVFGASGWNASTVAWLASHSEHAPQAELAAANLDVGLFGGMEDQPDGGSPVEVAVDPQAEIPETS
jgi:hypothetical protein